MHINLPIMLPEAAEDTETVVMGKLPAPSSVVIEPVGRWFEAYCNRRRNKQSLSHHSLRSSSSSESSEDLSDEDEDDEQLLRSLDPKEWKKQDHYAVLGLAKLRYKASDDQIKRAYKKKVLRHHPDKRRARGLEVKEGDDDYFTCITRAFETLGNPVKRRSYDSVDPIFDDTIPNVTPESKENFFKVFGIAFESNARWSMKKTAPPMLGGEKDTFEQVNNFYSFWYDFESWREYSYLDEEEKEKGENREERRWIEKQNKAARQKRKKEEVTRIRTLVDNAYACDPRIQRFKEEEKAKKLAQKEAKKEAARQRAAEEEKAKQEALEAERKKKEQEEEEAKAQAAAVKKEKDAQKKAIKKERKTMRNMLKDYEYFASDETERVHNMQEVDKLAEVLDLLSLQAFNKDLTSGDKDVAQKAFTQQVEDMNIKLEEEKQRQMEAAQRSGGGGGGADSASSKSVWSPDEMAGLVKAVKVFPAGTVDRWEAMATFLHTHVPGCKRNPREVLIKTKEMQKLDPSQIAEANKHAFERFNQSVTAAATAEKAQVSQRFESVAEQQIGETGSNPAPWSAAEQKALEAALKQFPATADQRWEKISELIPTRSKKDCMKRYKELVEMIRAKKAAAAKKK